MGGVMTGTRLERLVQLRRHVEMQIATEAHAVALGITTDTRAAAPGDSPVPSEPSLESLVTIPAQDVRPEAIRTWAAENGYGEFKRRIPRDVTLAYVEAHR